MARSTTAFRLSSFVLGSVLFFSGFTPVKDPGFTSFTAPTGKFPIDKSKSSVAFTVTHMVVSEAEGSFKVFNGSLESEKPDFTDAKIEFSVDVKSVNTSNENRDKHLKGPDFFDSGKFPVMKFVSTSFTHLDGSNYKLSGNLTIKEVTKPVTFTVIYSGLSSDQKTAVFNAKTTLDRFDYGLQWSKMTEAGGLVVSKDVRVNVTAAFKVK